MIPVGPVTIGLIHTTTESTVGNSVDYDATTISNCWKGGRWKWQGKISIRNIRQTFWLNTNSNWI
jgi:hypothetical protein